jgi:hypothetical protein
MCNGLPPSGASEDEMTSHGTRQSHTYLERVLDGEASSDGALGGLIAAARMPETHANPPGLAAALTAFREVSARPSAHPRSTSMIKNVAAKVLAAKFLAVAGLAAAAATGGIAAAASTGHLPSPLPHSSHASEVAVAAVAASHGQPTSTATGSASASGTAEPSSSHPAASPSPSLRGLCQAWLSRPHEHGKADTNPAFSYLVSTAGGIDSVDAYCSSLLASPAPSSTASDESSAPGGEPSAVPSHSHPAPTRSHPSGKPSTVPPTKH